MVNVKVTNVDEEHDAFANKNSSNQWKVLDLNLPSWM